MTTLKELIFAIGLIFLVNILSSQNGVECSGVCEQASDTGMCRGMFPRWYYNMHTKKCEVFTYGGCGGNHNNFQNFDECESTCIKKEPAILSRNDNNHDNDDDNHVTTTSNAEVKFNSNHNLLNNIQACKQQQQHQVNHGRSSAMEWLLNPYVMAVSFLHALCLNLF